MFQQFWNSGCTFHYLILVSDLQFKIRRSILNIIIIIIIIIIMMMMIIIIIVVDDDVVVICKTSTKISKYN